MPVFLRFLGIGLIAQVGTRLPNRTARTLSSLALIVANLLPLWAVARGTLGVGDVFVIYWLENVVVWFTTTFKILTARGGAEPAGGLNSRAALAAFFAFHFGIFTVVHGGFSLTIAFMTGGFQGGLGYWILAVGFMLASHLISLGLNWFGQGERNVVTPNGAMAMPYPRMLVLHGAVIGAFFFLIGPDGEPTRGVGAVVLLCGLKTAVDLAFHLRERFAARGLQ